jgi:hypothetical protein
MRVGPGDLFLFFGLFREAERADDGWRFHGPRRHVLFGWLQVGEVIGSGWPNWLADHHPHARDGWPCNNTVYVARERLSFAPWAQGAGLLPRGHVLTGEEQPMLSLWRVPAWLDPAAGGTGMTFHKPASWLGGGLLRAASRGQEFVADVGGRRDALDWIGDLLAG